MTSHLPQNHPHIPSSKIGVMIVNLGTPQAPTYKGVRSYLKEFLSDKRVIELPPLLWKPILYGIILTFRPLKTSKLYEKIWNKQSNESPLLHITRQQTQALKKRFENQYPQLVIDFAMRYGQPDISKILKNFNEKGVRKLLVLPLYPQYSATTTATVYDGIFKHLMKERWQPALRTAPSYHEHPLYIKALSQQIKEYMKNTPWEPEKIITSYHGLPHKYFMKGDPYHCQCYKTTRLLKESLPEQWHEKIMLTFQSRFGPSRWLEPSTQETVVQLAQKGTKNIAIIAPGFSADCLETLEEIQYEIQDEFKQHGGKNFAFIPCLNHEDQAIDLFENMMKQELKGWI